MNRFRRTLNRTRNVGYESSPAPPPTHPTRPSTSPAQSWTTHDSNLALLKCLLTATPTRPALPAEIILQILDHPERWVPLHSVAHAPSVDPTKPFVIGDRATGIPVLYTRPFLARETRRLRKVEFAFRSRDQGWSSHPDGGSWSWFEASLARFPSSDEDGERQDADADAAEWTGSYGWTEEWMERHGKRLEDEPRYKIQTNRHASREIQDYTIELTDEHELVQRAKEGDRVVLWGCACFPGWENRVYEAKISVLAMDDFAMEREKADQ